MRGIGLRIYCNTKYNGDKMQMKQKILTSVMLGSFAISPALSCKEAVKVPQQEGLSKNGCVRELQQTADCSLKNGHVRFRNARGKSFDIMHGQLVCSGSIRTAVNKVEGANIEMLEVRFDDMVKKNPDTPKYVKVLPCRD